MGMEKSRKQTANSKKDRKTNSKCRLPDNKEAVNEPENPTSAFRTEKRVSVEKSLSSPTTNDPKVSTPKGGRKVSMDSSSELTLDDLKAWKPSTEDSLSESTPDHLTGSKAEVPNIPHESLRGSLGAIGVSCFQGLEEDLDSENNKASKISLATATKTMNKKELNVPSMKEDDGDIGGTFNNNLDSQDRFEKGPQDFGSKNNEGFKFPSARSTNNMPSMRGSEVGMTMFALEEECDLPCKEQQKKEMSEDGQTKIEK